MFDVAVVGSGFAGSLLAMIARRLGLRVVLLERGRHPRFAIGESASPLAGVVLEQLAVRYGLPRLAPLASYGAWTRTYPGVGCGLKRGFTYYKQVPGSAYRAAPDRSNQLLVAASRSDELSDTHWLRADVDQFLLQDAVALGAEYLDGVQLERAALEADARVTLEGRRTDTAGGTAPVRIQARGVVDASGPRGFLPRALGIPHSGFAAYPDTQALFSHFRGVARCAELPEYATSERPPYPVDAAALHHVFDEGWMWVLRFDNGITSAGVAVTDRMAADLRLADGAAAWARLLSRYPSLAAQFADAEPVREFTWMPRLPFRVAGAVGPRWALLPSAAAFVDPLFSTGIPLTLLGLERLGGLLERGEWPAHAATRGAADYGEVTLAEADHTARFIAGCYAAFPRFETFTAYAMCYFVAASFSEMARRLGRAERASGFLGQGHAPFVAAVSALSPALRPASESHTAYALETARAIAALNIAGLCDPGKRNWYGVDLNDVVRGAEKLGLSPATVRDWISFQPGQLS